MCVRGARFGHAIAILHTFWNKRDRKMPFLVRFVPKSVQKCDRTSHARKRAARTHISHTFQNGFCTHTCDRTSHVCVCARTHAMSGCTYACACEIHSGKCAGCVCVRLFFGRAMCDHTFAHFLGQNCQKMLHFRTSFTVLEHLFLFWIILFCFRTSYSVLQHLILF